MPQLPEFPCENGPERSPEIGAEAVNRVRFGQRILCSPFLYKIFENDEDRRLLAEWKQEIDQMIERADQRLQRGTHSVKRQQVMTLALGEHPTREDIILFCIAEFVLFKQKTAGSGQFEFKALRKFLPGGMHHIAEFGKTYDTCVDSAVIVQTLAEMYGIQGNVVQPKTGPVWDRIAHYHWQQSEGKEAIIDTFWLKNHFGYLNKPKEFDRVQKR